MPRPLADYRHWTAERLAALHDDVLPIVHARLVENVRIMTNMERLAAAEVARRARVSERDDTGTQSEGGS